MTQLDICKLDGQRSVLPFLMQQTACGNLTTTFKTVHFAPLSVNTALFDSTCGESLSTDQSEPYNQSEFEPAQPSTGSETSIFTTKSLKVNHCTAKPSKP